MADISAFKANLALGGARANQFYVQLQFPASVGAGPIIGQKGQFLCKGAQLPASTIDNTPVNYRGRQVNLAGERTFAPWTITILNDNDFALRNAFEAWMNSINNNATNTGNIIPKSEENLAPKYQDVFGETILDLAQKNENIIGITVEKPIPIASQPNMTPPVPPTIKPEANPMPAINPPPIINFIGPKRTANRSPKRRPITIAAEKLM